jgi:uncharacterized repeat protein (TIGR03803 family)
MLTLTTLASFNDANGEYPQGGLIADAAGDLFGTTSQGGANGDGTVFEIDRTDGGYAGAPTSLVSFDGADGAYPQEVSLIADAAGDLFGTTENGGGNGQYGYYGTVFEIAKTAGGYLGAPTTLVSFTGAYGVFPEGGLIADAAGDLFGATLGTVFEIAKTAGGYAGMPDILSSSIGSSAGLFADAAGDLFGTTSGGGADNDGTVFEIAKTVEGYASAPTILASFTGADGSDPRGGLIADAAGNLIGTTEFGGSSDDGTVFEIARTAGGYAGTPITLVNFTGANGQYPVSSLIADAAGDLFGATSGGGADGDYGTVFEIAKTLGGYASTPITLVSFNVGNGAYPGGDLITDPAGDLFGTTAAGGTSGAGTVFEITDSSFVKKVFTFTAGKDNLHGGPENDAFFATANTLSKGDVVVGGTATNVLELRGGGTFDMRAPATLTGIPTVTVTEGSGTAQPLLYLRNGLDVTVNVSSGTGTKPGITITGANDASIIDLGGGTDTVTVGSPDETINGGGGVDTIKVTGTTIGATIDGGAGESILELTTAGPAAMGANITDIRNVKLTKAATFTANALSGLTIVGSGSADRITAGGAGQILTGDGGPDALIGAASGGDTFLDTTAHLVLDTIQGFVAGDVIDITNLHPSKTTTASWASGVLSVTQGVKTYDIAVPGSFTGTFTVSSDGKSGADITYAASPMTTPMVQAMANFGAYTSGSSQSAAISQLNGRLAPLSLPRA